LVALSVLGMGDGMSNRFLSSLSRFGVIEIGVLLAAIALLAWLSIPSFNGSPPSPSNRIINNLRVIQNQKQLWAADKKKTDYDTPTEADLAEYFNNGRFPSTVIGEAYRINPVSKSPVAKVPSRIRYGGKIIEAGGELTLDESQ
jgi:hypothetical protein